MVAPKRTIVHPGWVVTSNHQEHDHAPESTSLAPRAPARAAALPLPVPRRHLAGLPVCPDRPPDRPHHAGLRARLAARRRRQVAPVLRLLPPRPLVPHRLPARDHQPRPADALPRRAARAAVVGGRHHHQRQAVRAPGLRHPPLLARLSAARAGADPPGPWLAAAGPPLPAARSLLAGAAGGMRQDSDLGLRG